MRAPNARTRLCPVAALVAGPIGVTAVPGSLPLSLAVSLVIRHRTGQRGRARSIKCGTGGQNWSGSPGRNRSRGASALHWI
jgi:hypothetical protein